MLSPLHLPLLALALASGTAAQERSFIPVDDAPDGDLPVEVEFTLDGSRVLVLHHHSDDLTFIDATTQAITDVVPVGIGPLDMALTPDGLRVVTVNHDEGSLTLVSLASRSVVGTVLLSGTHPYQIEITADGARAIVGCSGDGPGGSTVSVVDLVAQVEIKSFPVADQLPIGVFIPRPWYTGEDWTGQRPPRYPVFDLAPNGVTLAMPDWAGNRLRLYNVIKGKPVGKPLLGMKPMAVRVTPDGLTAVAVRWNSSIMPVAVVDLATRSVQNYDVSGYNANDGEMLVTNTSAMIGSGAGITFLDLSTGQTELVSVPVLRMALTQDGLYLVTTTGVVVDLLSRTIVANLALLGRRVAASPIDGTVVVLQRSRAEALHTLWVNGAATLWTGTISTGLPHEGDAPVTVAVAEVGQLALTLNLLSNNVTVVDLQAGKPIDWISIDVAPWDVVQDLVVDAAGTVAVVTTRSDLFVLDLAAGVAHLIVQPGPHATFQQLVMRPDGSEAYAVLAHFNAPSEFMVIELAGAASQVVVQESLLFFTPGGGKPNRRLALSPQGIAAVPLLFADEVFLYDTNQRTVVGSLAYPNGTYPPRVVLSRDGEHGYVIQSVNNLKRVSKFRVEPNPKLVGGVVLERADWVGVDDEGKTLYVCTGIGNPMLSVVDTETMSEIVQLPLPQGSYDYELVGPFLLVAMFDGRLLRYRADREATAYMDEVQLEDFPRDLEFARALGAVVTAQPGKRDGIDVIHYGGSAESYCGPANFNSTGGSATIVREGWSVAGEPLTLVAQGLPPHQFGYFLVGDGQDFKAFVGGSQGNLCLGGSWVRMTDVVLDSGVSGKFSRVVDTGNLPFSPPVAVQAGETWYFQAWFRDANPQPTSNLTDGLAVSFD